MVAWIAAELGIGVAVMVGDAVYHGIVDKPVKPKPAKDLQVPHVEDGAPFAMLFGRCRARSPVLAWRGNARSEIGSVTNQAQDVERIYLMDMFFVIGLAMNDGNATSNVHNMWAGDVRFSFLGGIANTPRGVNTDGDPVYAFHGGSYEIFDGDSAQQLTDASGAATCEIAQRMIDDSTEAVTGLQIPGYRGYLSIGLFATGGFYWSLGPSQSLPAYSFEVSSYVDTDSYPATGIYARIGYDGNPVNALYDLLKAKHGKAGLDPATYIDPVSFGDAAITVHNEWNGYSRFVDHSSELDQHIADVLKQIEGMLYFDESVHQWKLKLIRADYNVRDILHLTKDNCIDVTNFNAGGWHAITNFVRVVFPNRDLDYNDDSAVAPSAGAGSDGLYEAVISYPGCCDPENAKRLARRDLALRAQPLMKFRALVFREFLRANPGDAIKVTLPEPDIAGLVFRVLAVDRGSPQDGKIVLDLVQDAAYTYRQVAPQPPGLDHPDIGDGVLLSVMGG